jgi:hypothetical protein
MSWTSRREAMGRSRSPLAWYVDRVRVASSASRRLDLVAGYFRLSAILSAVGLAFTLAIAAMHWTTFRTVVVAHPLAFAVFPISVGSWWWTARLIDQRLRSGAWMAMGSLGISLLNSLAAHRPGGGLTVVISGLGLAFIASGWRELD